MAHRSTSRHRRTGHCLVTVVVPTYNRADLTRASLLALLDSVEHRDDIEVVASDDGSTDGTPDVLAELSDRISVVASSTNQGFAAACNAGAAKAAGPWLLFYNNDLVPLPGWIDELVAYMRATPTAAAVGTKLLFPDGRVQHAGVVMCSDGYPRHLYAGFPADHPLVNRSGRVRLVTGACMLISRVWFERLNGFDSEYRNGYEDIDLCFRLADLGGEVHMCHRSVLTHLVSATRDDQSTEFVNTRRLFLRRWQHALADDFAQYVRDGLVKMTYTETFPFHMTVSPLLALVGGSADGVDTYASLTGELHDVRRENVRLRLRVAELEALARSLDLQAPDGRER